MDREYLERNRRRQISATFLGTTVNCFVDEDEHDRAQERGHLDALNRGVRQYLSGALLTPTLKYLIHNKLSVSADVSGMRDRYLIDTLYTKRIALDKLLIQEHDRSDAYLFLYAGDNAYRSILKCGHLYRTPTCSGRDKKLIGVYYDHCSYLEDNQIMFGAIPKVLIATDKFIPQFVQDIIDNQ